MTATRRFTFAIYPNATQRAALDKMRTMSCTLYNACIEQRRDAWDRRRKSLGKFDQQREATALAQSDPYWRALPSAMREKTVERVDQAYAKYFDNVKRWKRQRDGLPPKPPHYRKLADYPGIGLREHGKGWRLRCDVATKLRGKVYIQAVGDMRIRGQFPQQPDDVRSADLLYRNGKWSISIVVKFEELRPMRGRTLANFPAEASKWLRDINGLCKIRSGDLEIAGHAQGSRSLLMFNSRSGDLEIASHAQGAMTTSVRPLGSGDLEIAGHAQERPGRSIHVWRSGDLERARRQSRGKKCRKAREDNKRARRNHWLHEYSSAIAKAHDDIVIERPPLIAATKSARGTVTDPGAMVQFKAEQNRRLLDRGVGAFCAMMEYKSSAKIIDVQDHDAMMPVEIVALAKVAKKAKRIRRRA